MWSTWVIGLAAIGWLTITIAVLDDAERRGDSRLWGLVTLLFANFGATLYLLYRNEKTQRYRCEQCRNIFSRESGINRHERNTGHTVSEDSEKSGRS